MELIFNDRNPRSGSKDRVGKVTSRDISNIRSITATGNVKMVEKETMATAGKALYDHLKRTITLTGGPPRFWQGPDMVIADMIIIYLDENRAELKSGNDTKIKLIIPGKKEQEK
jgi:lipopolysaccharide export system protein LptA